jgi:hypothetical protein
LAALARRTASSERTPARSGARDTCEARRSHRRRHPTPAATGGRPARRPPGPGARPRRSRRRASPRCRGRWWRRLRRPAARAALEEILDLAVEALLPLLVGGGMAPALLRPGLLDHVHVAELGGGRVVGVEQVHRIEPAHRPMVVREHLEPVVHAARARARWRRRRPRCRRRR